MGAGHDVVMVKFPAPLRPGDRIGVTSPSAGAAGAGAERVAFCVEWLRQAGYDVVVGDCMDGTGITAGPAADRATELTEMLCDPTIRCVLPPWGGETAIDLLDLLDWDALGRAEPTWVVGYSDLSTVLLPLTTRLGWATVHGDNLADTPYRAPAGLLGWLDVVSGRGPHRQRDSGLVARGRRSRRTRRRSRGGPSARAAGRCSAVSRCGRAAVSSVGASRRSRTSPAPRSATFRRSAGSTPSRGSSSTSRPPRTEPPPSAGTCTASGSPAGSSTHGPSSSAGRPLRTTRG